MKKKGKRKTTSRREPFLRRDASSVYRLLLFAPIPPRTSHATEEGEAEAEAETEKGAAVFSLPKASSKFARGGSVSENERAACASDCAASEDEGEEFKRRFEEGERRRLWRCCEEAIEEEEREGDSSEEARGDESGRRTPQPEKRSCFHFWVLFDFAKKTHYLIGSEPETNAKERARRSRSRESESACEKPKAEEESEREGAKKNEQNPNIYRDEVERVGAAAPPLGADPERVRRRHGGDADGRGAVEVRRRGRPEVRREARRGARGEEGGV